MQSDLVFHWPLIIEENENQKKDDKSHFAYNLFTKGYWFVFRAASGILPLLEREVYLISSKYGLIPYFTEIEKYEIDNDLEKKRKSKFISLLKKQIKDLKLQKNVLFVGSEKYKELLEDAGLFVLPLEDLDDFPNKSRKSRTVSEKQRKKSLSLRWFLGLIGGSENVLLKLPRFKNEKDFKIGFESRYKQFQKFADDPTKGAKKQKQRKKLKPKDFLYDPFKRADEIIDVASVMNQSMDALAGAPISEIIYLWLLSEPSKEFMQSGLRSFESRESFFPYLSAFDEDFEQSPFYFSRDDLADWFRIPKLKADGTEIFSRWDMVKFLYYVFVRDESVTPAARQFVLSELMSKIESLCKQEKIERKNLEFCKANDEKEVSKALAQVEKILSNTERVMHRYPIDENTWEKEVAPLRNYNKLVYPKEMEVYKRKIKEIDDLYRKERKEYWLKNQKPLPVDKFKEMKRKIKKPMKKDIPPYYRSIEEKELYEQRDLGLLSKKQFRKERKNLEMTFESPLMKRIGRDLYINLLEFLGRYLAGKEDRYIIQAVSMDTAFDFIKKHHSALPDANPKGLMMTLAVMDTDGKIGAVATVNTPTGRWDLSEREGLDHRNVVELTRVASDGSIKGASSMLTSRVIDLLPYLGRGDPSKKNLFITYSLDKEEGTTYKALRDKGLRPVAFIKGKGEVGGGSRKVVSTGLPNVDKIRWEAGSGALKGNWKLLDPKYIEKLSKGKVTRDEIFNTANFYLRQYRDEIQKFYNSDIVRDTEEKKNLFLYLPSSPSSIWNKVTVDEDEGLLNFSTFKNQKQRTIYENAVWYVIHYDFVQFFLEVKRNEQGKVISETPEIQYTFSPYSIHVTLDKNLNLWSITGEVGGGSYFNENYTFLFYASPDVKETKSVWGDFINADEYDNWTTWAFVNRYYKMRRLSTPEKFSAPNHIEAERQFERWKKRLK